MEAAATSTGASFVKPSRKLSRGSFMSRVSGGNRAGFGGGGGKGPPAAASDHDLAAPAGKEAEATDSDQ
jgi:hypothetical protein